MTTICMACDKEKALYCLNCAEEQYGDKIRPIIYDNSWKFTDKPDIQYANKCKDRFVTVVAVSARRPIMTCIDLESWAKSFTRVEWWGYRRRTYAVRQYYVKTMYKKQFLRSVRRVGGRFMTSKEWRKKVRENR